MESKVDARRPRKLRDETARRFGRWVAGLGLVLLTLGIGFAVDRDPPFTRAGTIVGIVGAVCLLLPGWFDFGRKDHW